MYCILYQWVIIPGKKTEFVKAWHKMTRHYIDEYGAMEFRLHQVSENHYAAYAQWADKKSRIEAFGRSDEINDIVQEMQQYIVQRFEPLEMTLMTDEIVK
ncbi:antibiotic biosynthesis monooxygenase [Thalassotalea crassostreae]|uniref:antibiotic biosynthesis monooxygenase n=1 Tax=Thalassotalea crassostreae TaxID=1763536 RepID=UPI000838F46A|nr:antibiotic biosynthesis monooxygenase [Thalassotalea crassostreae]